MIICAAVVTMLALPAENTRVIVRHDSTQPLTITLPQNDPPSVGAVNSLDSSLRPEIIDDMSRGRNIVAVILGVVASIAVPIIFIRNLKTLVNTVMAVIILETAAVCALTIVTWFGREQQQGAYEAVPPERRITIDSSTVPADSLFIIARGRASGAGLVCATTDVFERRGDLFAGKDTGLIIGSPELKEMLWDGCVVTKLTGEIDPKRGDMEIRFTSPSPHRATVYTPGALMDAFLIKLMISVTICLVLCAFVFRRRRRVNYSAAVFPLAVTIVLALYCVDFWINAPVAGRPATISPAKIAEDMDMMRRKISRCVQTMGLEEFRDMMQKGWESMPPWLNRELMGSESKAPVNPFSDLPMKLERSPGNYWVYSDMDEDGTRETYFCTYDLDGVESRSCIRSRLVLQFLDEFDRIFAELRRQSETQPASKPATRQTTTGNP
jgi:hypothetical protein